MNSSEDNTMMPEKSGALRTTGILLGLSLAVAACGESDLKQLQLNEIDRAQQLAAAQAAQSPDTSGGNDNQTPNPAGPESPTNGETENPFVGGSDEPTAVETLLEGYQLAFSDEFNAATLNTNKWNTQYQWGPDLIVNDEEQYYVDINNTPDAGYNPFSFDGESLIITADITPADMLSTAKDQKYLSGVLTSYELFDFTYGYVEIRAKLPAGKGYWPGFWMLGSEFIDKKPQLYVMESRGDNDAVVYHRYNYSDTDDQFVFSDLLQSTGADFHNDFHTFGVEWSVGKLVFYVDGEEQHTIVDENVSSQDMYFILNLAVGGWFPEAPDNTTTFPGKFTIDYIRAYEKQ